MTHDDRNAHHFGAGLLASEMRPFDQFVGFLPMTSSIMAKNLAGLFASDKYLSA